MISFSSSDDYELPISYSGYCEEAAERLALVAGGWAETRRGNGQNSKPRKRLENAARSVPPARPELVEGGAHRVKRPAKRGCVGRHICKEHQKRVEQPHEWIKFIPLLLLVCFRFCQFSFPVLNIAIIPDPERQTTLVPNSEIFQSLSSWMKFAARTLCARK